MSVFVLNRLCILRSGTGTQHIHRNVRSYNRVQLFFWRVSHDLYKGGGRQEHELGMGGYENFMSLLPSVT